MNENNDRTKEGKWCRQKQKMYGRISNVNMMCIQYKTALISKQIEVYLSAAYIYGTTDSEMFFVYTTTEHNLLNE